MHCFLSLEAIFGFPESERNPLTTPPSPIASCVLDHCDRRAIKHTELIEGVDCTFFDFTKGYKPRSFIQFDWNIVKNNFMIQAFLQTC